MQREHVVSLDRQRSADLGDAEGPHTVCGLGERRGLDGRMRPARRRDFGGAARLELGLELRLAVEAAVVDLFLGGDHLVELAHRNVDARLEEVGEPLPGLGDLPLGADDVVAHLDDQLRLGEHLVELVGRQSPSSP